MTRRFADMPIGEWFIAESPNNPNGFAAMRVDDDHHVEDNIINIYGDLIIFPTTLWYVNREVLDWFEEEPAITLGASLGWVAIPLQPKRSTTVEPPCFCDHRSFPGHDSGCRWMEWRKVL